jgi:hypothetical protein
MIKGIASTVRTYQIGESIHLPPSDRRSSIPNPEQTNVVYRTTSQNKDSYMKQSYLDYQFTSHKVATYRSKLEYMLDTLKSSSSISEVTTDGYIAGTQCRLEFDCQESTECIDDICTLSINDNNNDNDNNDEQNNNPNNANCQEDSDCTSGRCDYALLLRQKQCKELQPSGSICTENSDCQSNQCKWTFTCR